LREFATLDKEVMLVGQGSHFEIWDMVAWRKQLSQVLESGDFTMPTELEGFSL
jgi:MraZ protein